MKLLSCVLVLGCVLSACNDALGPDGVRGYTAITTGGEHTCAVADDGAAYCWGRGLDGELGIGLKENRDVPAPVTGGLTFSQISAGDVHTCALTTNGQAYCWGWNVFFERGNAVDGRDSEPVPVSTSVRFRSISAGAHHTCALAVDSIAYCWGYNRYGQVGDSSTFTPFGPVAVHGGLKFTEISSGGFHTCGRTVAGAIYCWGQNDYGQLGIGSSVLNSLIPRPVNSAVVFAHVSAGRTHTCAISVNQEGYCWGGDEFGELGIGAPFKQGLAGALSPLPTALSPAMIAISAGVNVTCAISSAQNGFCWGRGQFGQLAVGSFGDNYYAQEIYLQPEQLHAGERLVFSAMATGGRTHTCGIADHSVFCWGTGQLGQLGRKGSTLASLPQRVSDQ